MDRMEIAKRLYKQAVMAALTMVSAVFIYGAVGYQAVEVQGISSMALDPKPYQMLRTGAWVIAMAIVFILWWTDQHFFQTTQMENQTPDRYPQKLFMRTTVQCAVAEVPAVFGTVLIFLGRHFYDYLPLAVISLIGFALVFPRKQKWSSWLGTDF